MTFQTWLLFLVMETAFVAVSGFPPCSMSFHRAYGRFRGGSRNVGDTERECYLLRALRHESRRAHRRQRALLHDRQVGGCRVSDLSRHQIAAVGRGQPCYRVDRHGGTGR